MDWLSREQRSHNIEIKGQGMEVLVSKMVAGLSELEALKLEAELISAFGTEDTGGLLTNSVQPSGRSRKPPSGTIVPLGACALARCGHNNGRGARKATYGFDLRRPAQREHEPDQEHGHQAGDADPPHAPRAGIPLQPAQARPAGRSRPSVPLP